MESERVLALDISSKTGWSLIVSSLEGVKLEAYGQIPSISEPVGTYPLNYLQWAEICFKKIFDLFDQLKPTVLVIEETASGSKSNYSQKILEWIHFLVAKMIKEYNIKTVYFLTEQWRRECGCIMTLSEKKKNKQVREYKKKVEKETGKKTTVAYDIDGSRIGLTNRKHVNVRRANEVFGPFLKTPLKKKDEDTADSLLLGYAYHLRRMSNHERLLAR